MKNGLAALVRAISIGLTIWLTSFVFILIFAFFELGHIPIYGFDYQLESVIFRTLRWIILAATIFAFIFTPFWFLILFNIIINNIKLIHGEWILQFLDYSRWVFFFSLNLYGQVNFFGYMTRGDDLLCHMIL